MWFKVSVQILPHGGEKWERKGEVVYIHDNFDITTFLHPIRVLLNFCQEIKKQSGKTIIAYLIWLRPPFWLRG